MRIVIDTNVIASAIIFGDIEILTVVDFLNRLESPE